MRAGMLRTIAVAALCCSDGAFAVAYSAPRHAPAFVQGSATSSANTLKASRRSPPARTPATDRNSHADRAYKADYLSTPRTTQPILNIPGQTTVLTRQVLDDMNATSVRDALRSTAGVTIGR